MKPAPQKSDDCSLALLRLNAGPLLGAGLAGKFATVEGGWGKRM